MRKYYIFDIQKSAFQSYKNKTYSLYALLGRIKKTKKGMERSSLSLYHQVCLPFDTSRLQNYFKDKYRVPKRKHYYFLNHGKTSLLELHPSCFILLSTTQFPKLFHVLSYYSSHLFVCDFENGDYFFVSEILKKVT